MQLNVETSEKPPGWKRQNLFALFERFSKLSYFHHQFSLPFLGFYTNLRAMQTQPSKWRKDWNTSGGRTRRAPLTKAWLLQLNVRSSFSFGKTSLSGVPQTMRRGSKQLPPKQKEMEVCGVSTLSMNARLCARVYLCLSARLNASLCPWLKGITGIVRSHGRLLGALHHGRWGQTEFNVERELTQKRFFFFLNFKDNCTLHTYSG